MTQIGHSLLLLLLAHDQRKVRLEFTTAMERSVMAYLQPLSRWSGVITAP